MLDYIVTFPASFLPTTMLTNDYQIWRVNIHNPMNVINSDPLLSRHKSTTNNTNHRRFRHYQVPAEQYEGPLPGPAPFDLDRDFVKVWSPDPWENGWKWYSMVSCHFTNCFSTYKDVGWFLSSWTCARWDASSYPCCIDTWKEPPYLKSTVFLVFLLLMSFQSRVCF